MTDRLNVPQRFRRGTNPSEEWARESAASTLDYMRRHLDLESFADVDMLDVGCGSKFTQHFLETGEPIRRYVGIDVSVELVEFLRGEVDDPRFEYHHFDAHHARYNPAGQPITDETRFPMPDDERFDLICLLSVFTHLEPHDYVAMLKLLRRYARPHGRLFFSLFIDETTETGNGMMDKLSRMGAAVGTTERFQDLDPDNVLAYALYARDYAFELIEGTGWEVLSLDPPQHDIQHHFTCRPV